MVAEQPLDPPAGGLGLRLQRHEEVEQHADVRAAIHDVARLHEGRGAAAPVALGVDETCALQDGDEARAGPVHVGDRDDAAVGGRGRGEEQGDGDDE